MAHSQSQPSFQVPHPSLAQFQSRDRLEEEREAKALINMYPEPGIRETFVAGVRPMKTIKNI